MMRTIVWFAILAACGSSAPSDGVGFTVTSTTIAATLSNITPPPGGFFVVVTLALSNNGAKAELSTNPTLFTLDTSQATGVAPSPAVPTNACSATVTVPRGAQVVCELAFELAQGDAPTELVYNDGLGDTVTSGFPLFVGPSVACETVSGWLRGGNSTCTGCVGAAEQEANPPQPQGACFAQASHYTGTCNTCGITTLDLCTFEPSCDSQTCQALFETEQSCLVATCTTSCM